MPAPSTMQELLTLLKQSQLVSEQALAPFMPQAQSAAAMPNGPTQFVKFLVSKGVLTSFQAEQVLQGKWRGFFIGRYKVMQPVGSGGMANVFLCEHKFMKRQVALKVLPASKAKDSSFVERFYREARAAAALDHPNIVRAYDVSQENNLHFLVMEYVEGTTLHDLVKKNGPLPVADAVNYIGQAAAGLQHAYEAGLIHRDIKPSNLVIDRGGTVKVLDMGLARFFNDEQDNLTRKYDETVLGTADYLAPEQAMDSHTVDIRADVYSLGATLYFALTGKPPFGEGTVAQKLLWHQTKPPKSIRETRSDVPPDVEALVEKMMAKDPAKRFQTPADLVRAAGAISAAPPSDAKVDTMVTGGVGTHPELRLGEVASAGAKKISRVLPRIRAIPLPGPLARIPPRWRLWAAVGGALVLLLVLVLVLSLGGSGGTPGGKKKAANTAGEHPVATPGGSPVFLADLPEQDVVVFGGGSGWRFGKKGDLGPLNMRIKVKGVPAVNGLSTVPPGNANSRVAYRLGRKYRVCKAQAAIDDSAKDGSRTPLTFSVKGDGRILWKSNPIQKPGQPQNCLVPVEGVDRLELEVSCPGDNRGAHAVWVDPQVLP